ncbi:N-acetyltransferase family protein [Myceligenerans crystallogenes]|uniref:GNAT family N-acetyltransferase n=1 Tax=Myceligenerans crystallogenes TaxID=316335 RepID=A0ABP4ZU85_9MICO
MALRIRDATSHDAPACAAIYAHYVRTTALSFESEPPSDDEMARRIAAYGSSHAWLVAVDDDDVRGYAYGSPFSPREAYAWTAEVSVYLAPDAAGRGLGRALYEELFDRLRARGIRRLQAGISLPNDASLGLHRALGFEEVGTFRRVGWKHGRWWDVRRLQRDVLMDDDGGAPG